MTDAAPEQHGAFSLSGLKNALLGGGDKVSEQEKTQAAIHAAVREETKLKEERGEDVGGWRSKIKDLMDDDNSIQEEIKKYEAELAEIKADEADDTWTEKLAARFNGSQEAHRARVVELEGKIADARKREAEKQEGWKGKLKDVFDGEDDEGKERLKAEVNKNASWQEKLGDHFFGTPKEEKKEEGFSLSGKLNELAGGGKKSEANEDKLDKLVDLYQEHVLKQGPQNNESALEQAKDEQISDMIRSGFKMATGKDLPVKDKEH
ncbi:hypothetical protein RhiJN_11126 [Ceratobasidium sp. AG-Ba]|nr:hypothetical protein RhiJN_11126 [Ceratobasidium sp. AG-Ba]QRW11829.1 hypothetical protein RhiLY_10828 [Ceratobasidium sp. AG-Ba]